MVKIFCGLVASVIVVIAIETHVYAWFGVALLFTLMSIDSMINDGRTR